MGEWMHVVGFIIISLIWYAAGYIRGYRKGTAEKAWTPEERAAWVEKMVVKK